MVAYAMEHGVNYYDTAWGYHAGQSETVMGKVLKQYPRETFISPRSSPVTTWPIWIRLRKSLKNSLKNAAWSILTFIFFHNVCELNIDHYLDPKYGIFDYLIKQKENGRIRHLGFSIMEAATSCAGSSRHTACIWSSASYSSIISTGPSKTRRTKRSCSKSATSPFGSWSLCAAASWPRWTARIKRVCRPCARMKACRMGLPLPAVDSRRHGRALGHV